MTILAYWAARTSRPSSPRRFLYPLGSGTLGYSWPAALGRGGRSAGRTLAVVGDGGFLYGVGELGTRASTAGAKLLIVDDGGYGSCGSTSATPSARPSRSTSSSRTSRLSRAFGVPIEQRTPDASPRIRLGPCDGGRARGRPPPRPPRDVDADKLTMTDWSSLVAASLVGLEPYAPARASPSFGVSTASTRS